MFCYDAWTFAPVGIRAPALTRPQHPDVIASNAGLEWWVRVRASREPAAGNGRHAQIAVRDEEEEERHSMSRRLAGIAGLIASLLIVSPAAAITNGQPDAEEHPYVGELIFYVPDANDSRFDDPGGWFTCSGTLVSPTVVVTAGHCTFAVGLDGVSTTNGGEITTAAEGGTGGNDVWVDFSEVAHFDGLPPTSTYARDENQDRYEDWARWLNRHRSWHRGTAHPHPEYDDNAFYIHDGGVVVLDEPVKGISRFGRVPTLGYLDRYETRRGSDHLFEVVGYGLTDSGPFTAEGGDVRLKGDVKLNSLNASPPDTYALFSNNPGEAHEGGTCFGDSGGPIFDDTNSNLVVSVTSFGFSSTCSGTGGGYRLDQPDDLAFLATFGISP